jgi:hypothetical protein
MSLADFQELVDRFGDEPDAWPEKIRPVALAFSEESDQAKKILNHAKTIREALTAPPVKAPAGLVDRIVAKALQTDPPQSRRRDS